MAPADVPIANAVHELRRWRVQRPTITAVKQPAPNAMTNTTIEAKDAPDFDPPDAKRVYRNHLETCRGLGVQSVPRDRAQDLIAEWSDAIADRQPPLR